MFVNPAEMVVHLFLAFCVVVSLTEAYCIIFVPSSMSSGSMSTLLGEVYRYALLMKIAAFVHQWVMRDSHKVEPVAVSATILNPPGAQHQCWQ